MEETGFRQIGWRTKRNQKGHSRRRNDSYLRRLPSGKRHCFVLLEGRYKDQKNDKSGKRVAEDRLNRSRIAKGLRMNLISKNGLLRRIKKGRKARAQLVSSNLSEGIAFQIRATRDKREMTQASLARESGMTPNNLSRLESPDYGKQTISSLKRIAEGWTLLSLCDSFLSVNT